jgi:hypothetical protein
MPLREGPNSPEGLSSLYGAAVSGGNVAYFSPPNSRSILTFTLSDNKWGTLSVSCPCSCSGLAIVNNKLTTIGGTYNINHANSVTNGLFSWNDNWLGKKWKDINSPMPTRRMCPAAVTTSSYLLVAGGSLSKHDGKLPAVEVMKMDTLEWFLANDTPPIPYPQMVISGDFLVLSDESTVFCCSFNNLLTKSYQLGTIQDRSQSTVWYRNASIPVQKSSSLVVVKDLVLAIGGKTGDASTDKIYQYSPSSNSWDVIGHMLTPRSNVLTVNLANELMIVGGKCDDDYCFKTEMGKCSL